MGTLFDQLTALPLLVRAFDRVEENQGGSGVDGETVLDFGVFLERNLMSLQKALVTGTYRPSPLLRVYVDPHSARPRGPDRGSHGVDASTGA